MTTADVQLLFQALAGIGTVQVWQLTMQLILLGILLVVVILLAAMRYR